ncbi:type IV toxin-antitoxin system AbiEi family antitoxin domain-containing protein [Mumia sp. DW29H23]|uniref:type IV toxin-antitoxin system AbiEi family antitoxin domain-containing protein n=1 Tax=Mumia sp. DW29H23 TaxID=3421241 RepID=UPI003D681896
MERLEKVARRNRGYATRRQAKDLGYGSNDLARQVADGGWVKLRRGVYAPASTQAAASPREQQLVVIRSVLAALGPEYAASHDSALVVHGVMLDDLDTDVVHVARVGGTTSRRRNGIHRHRDALGAADVVVVDEIRVVRAPRATAQVMCTSSLDDAAIVAWAWLASRRSAALLGGMPEEFSQEAAKAELREVLVGFGKRPGTRDAKDAVEITDARCDSPAEVRVLVLCWRFDIPRPEPQYVIALPGGRHAEADFGWPSVRHVLEFDGAMKYEDDPAQGMTARDKILAEKRREREIRDLGYGVTRLTWADLTEANQARTAARIKRDLARSARTFGTR